MLDVIGDLWEYSRNCDAVVITTNGTVKKNGQAVMGRGCAAEAAKRYPWLPERLGKMLTASGNELFLFYVSPEQGVTMPLVTFPVKHNWWEKADWGLIVQSTKNLAVLATIREWKRIVMPRPGCGNGQLEWSDVRPLIDSILDDRFHVITWEAFS